MCLHRPKLQSGSLGEAQGYFVNQLTSKYNNNRDIKEKDMSYLRLPVILTLIKESAFYDFCGKYSYCHLYNIYLSVCLLSTCQSVSVKM